jgi:16S rRNA (guanine1207-N2)-methyltransferase
LGELLPKQDEAGGSWVMGETQQLPDGPAALCYLPGVPRYGAAHLALFRAVRRITESTVFVTGPGAAPAAVWAARSGAEVIAWHDSIAEHISLVRSLAANGCRAKQASLRHDFSELNAHDCDLALLHLPRGREQQTEMLQLGVSMLRPGGRLVFVGATNEGVRAALRDAVELCGRAGIVSRKGGTHAGVAYAPSRLLPLPDVPIIDHVIELDGHAAVLRSYSGVFASDRLDGGAAALIEAMEIASGTQVLDLGCGTGLVGLAASVRGACLTATDVSARAVVSTERTLEANGVSADRVDLCVGATSVASAAIDTVVTNPPFHRGHDVDFEVSRLFVSEAARVLRPGGSLFLVANSFLDYQPWIAQHFTSVRVASESPTFRVWGGRK